MRVRSIAFSLIATLSAAAANAQSFKGPSSSQTPYVEPTAPGWAVVSLLTTGDSPAFDPSYRMVGIPDGLGAVRGRLSDGRYVSKEHFITVFMNHELPAGTGVPRAHGTNGAFVSRWTIDLDTLLVTRGQDLIRNVYLWDAATSAYVFSPTATFSRFCSADLPPLTAFYNPATKRGFKGRLFMNGEESGAEGRGFAHVLSGDLEGSSFELPFLGKFSWENSLAHPRTGDKTVVVGSEDGTPGSLYVYVGDKRAQGNPVERAGLVGGKLWGVKVVNGGSNYGGGAVTIENAGAVNGRFILADVSSAVPGTGAALQAATVAAGVTEFARPEDAAWDPTNRNVLYFVTTGATVRAGTPFQSSRLYRLTFDNIDAPAAGGSIDLIVDSRDGAALPRGTDLPPATIALFDNITVDGRGHVLVQEDPGGNAYVAKTWDIDPVAKKGVQIFESDRDRFDPAVTLTPITVDEESSGIIEVTDLVTSAWWYQHGRRYYLGDLQAHNPIPGELVEGGQLYLLVSPRETHRHGKK
jgi:hypothetical protein